MTTNNFEALASINVNDKIEKKGNLSYLSWAWAVDKVMRKDPSATWEFLQPIVYPDTTMMVHCNVTVFGKKLYMWLPVMDHRNKAIQNPNAFDINKNMMRCLAKGLAVHGLGLYIYAGEDLPEPDTETKERAKKSELQESFDKAVVFINNATKETQFIAVIERFKDTEYNEQIVDLVNSRKKELV